MNSGLEPCGPRLLIPEGNLGAKMLAKLGWRDDGRRPGLGRPGREGRLMPVAVALKRDTAGLGAKSYERRVTHRPDETPPAAPRREPDARALRRQIYGDDPPPGLEALFEDGDDAEPTPPPKKKGKRSSRRR